MRYFVKKFYQIIQLCLILLPSDIGKARTEEEMNYELLEQIKNGRTLAAKFDSKELKFHTPNVVVVFSNERPEEDQLSKDRWKIFQIRDDDLLDATDKYV